MRLHPSIPLLALMSFACVASGQVKPGSTAVTNPTAEQPDSTSKTYDDTLRMLKLRADSEVDETANLARLFTLGDARSSDLLAACQIEGDEIAGAAFIILDFLGAPGLRTCMELLDRRYGGMLHSVGANLSLADAERIDHWLAGKRTASGYKCGEDESDIDGAVLYALILDGSTLSKSALVKLRPYADACMGGDSLDLVKEADPLIVLAGKIAHNLKIEPDIREAIRASAFFLPPESRKDSDVEVVARADHRILLKVTYREGYKGGGIFYTVLRKDGFVWQYALIRRWAYF